MSSPIENLAVESIFTGVIVVSMLGTLTYLVFKRKKRFGRMEYDLQKKMTRKENDKDS